MLLQHNITQSFQSPLVRVMLIAIGIGLLYILWREVRKIPAKLLTLMATAFVDMVGVLMIFPLLPFYVKSLGGSGINLLGLHFGIGIITGFIIAAFTVAQLVSAPVWGRFSDRIGRRPILIIALTASGIAYLIFGFAESLLVLFISRIVQGAGGGTVGVIQAYVADSTAPQDRARALGWLSATTNLGVALGPVLGSFAIAIGKRDLMPGAGTLHLGQAAPGIFAATLCFINILFAARYIKESRNASDHAPVEGREVAVVADPVDAGRATEAGLERDDELPASCDLPVPLAPAREAELVVQHEERPARAAAQRHQAGVADPNLLLAIP